MVQLLLIRELVFVSGCIKSIYQSVQDYYTCVRISSQQWIYYER